MEFLKDGDISSVNLNNDQNRQLDMLVEIKKKIDDKVAVDLSGYIKKGEDLDVYPIRDDLQPVPVEYVKTYNREGPEGPAGEPGPEGYAGPQGIKGIRGHQGLEGQDGEKGPPGLKGNPGPQGPAGVGFVITGYATTDEILAKPGHEAELWISTDTGHGYSWNPILLEWNDVGPIVGNQGQQGDKGPLGPQGQKGREGFDGEEGPQGQIGNQGEQGEQGPKGPEGDPGPKGDEGPRGPDSVSPPMSGIIMPWFSSIIPDGWVLCNGANGTPNMNDRYPIQGSNVGTLLGTTDVTIPSHTHTATSSSSSSTTFTASAYDTHTHNFRRIFTQNPGGDYYQTRTENDPNVFWDLGVGSPTVATSVTPPKGTVSTATSTSTTISQNGVTPGTYDNFPLSVRCFFIMKT